MRSARRLMAFPILVLALAGIASGCGAAATGVVVGLSLADGSSSGGRQPNRPPRVESPQVVGGPYDKITIEYLAVDGGSDPIDIAVEFSTDGGVSFAPSPATECIGPTSASDGIVDLATSPAPGTTHTFVWDSFLDLGCRNIPGSDLVIRITPTETGAGGIVGDPGFLSFDLLNNFIAWITTVAGGGISANALAGPVIDPNGDLLLCDITGHQIVLKRDADGGIDILAGTGFPGFNGDNLDGRSAKLNGPAAAVIDPNGTDILFTDSNNHRVCRIDFSGFLTTEIGTGLPGFVDGPRSIAWLDSPSGLAIDPNGNLYVADSGNDRIRCWNREGGTITIAGVAIPSGEVQTIAGDGTGGPPTDASPAISAVVPSPKLLAIDWQGNLFTTSREVSGSDRVRVINPSSSLRTILGTQVAANGIGTVGGGGVEFGEGGAATAANLGEVTGLVINGAGDLILTSWNRVRRIDSTGTISTIAGDGTRGFGGVDVVAPQAQFDFTSPLVMNNVGVDPAGNVFVTMLDDVRVVNREGTDIMRSGISIAAGTVGRITPGSSLEPYVQTKVPLMGAGQVAAGVPDLLASGEAFVADGGNHRVARVDIVTGAVTTTVGITGFGGYAGDGGPPDAAGLTNAGGIAVDSNGNLIIADTQNHVIRYANLSGSPVNVGGVMVPAGQIATIAGTGVPGSSDGTPPTNGQMDSPRGVSLDWAGNIYVADTGNHLVRVINTEGASFSIGAVTVLPDWMVRVAGTGSAGPAADGGPATSADLSSPESVGVDGARNLYIVDTGNDRIRLVNAATLPAIRIYTATGAERTVAPGIIDTIAGGGACPEAPGPLAAVSACLRLPRAIETSDLEVNGGSIEGWILVSAGSRVRAINAGTPTGLPATLAGVDITVGVGDIDTIAGTGEAASTGNGGSAGQAEVLDPAGLSWDWDGTSGSAVLLVQEPSSLRAINLSGSTQNLGLVLIFPGEINEIVRGSIGSPPLRIADPGPVVAEPDGDLLIADGRKVIYHLDRSTELLTRVAGDGVQEGFVGDGDFAFASRISSPGDLALDSSGNLYIADTGNARIRVVNLTGADTTLAGVPVDAGKIQTLAGPVDGLITPLSLAVDSSADIYFADPGSQTVGVIVGTSGLVTPLNPNGPPSGNSSGDGAAALDADIADPRSIAMDGSGNIYVVDGGYSDGIARIRVISRSGTIRVFQGTPSEVTILNGNIDVVAGQPLPPLAPSSEGDLVDAWDLRLRSPYPDKILLAESRFAPGVFDIFYTHAGGGSRVRKIDGVTGLVTTVAGRFGSVGFNGDDIPATMADLNGPTGLTWFTDNLIDDTGKLLLVVSDTDNRRVRRFAP